MTSQSQARAVVLTLLALISSYAVAQAPTFKRLINPTGGATWANYSLSRDGKVMAANYGGSIYRWSPDTPSFPFGGFTFIGKGDFLNSSIGISSDGMTIITGRPVADGTTNPAIWSQDSGWTDLGHPANGCSMDNSWGSGYDITADGSTAVGLSWYCPGAEGFVWNRTNGMRPLSHPAKASSRASAISANGSVIVGFFEHPRYGYRRPVQWIAGKADLFAGTEAPGEATAATSDGSQIVGQVFDQNSVYAFHYSDKGGMVSLGTVSGNVYDQSIANAIADNGTTVGWSGDPFGAGIEAFIWSPTLKMQSLKRYLQNRGVLIPAGMTLTTALDISADGSTIVGTWQDASYNQGGWMVRLRK